MDIKLVEAWYAEVQKVHNENQNPCFEHFLREQQAIIDKVIVQAHKSGYEDAAKEYREAANKRIKEIGQEIKNKTNEAFNEGIAFAQEKRGP